MVRYTRSRLSNCWMTTRPLLLSEYSRFYLCCYRGLESLFSGQTQPTDWRSTSNSGRGDIYCIVASLHAPLRPRSPHMSLATSSIKLVLKQKLYNLISIPSCRSDYHLESLHLTRRRTLGTVSPAMPCARSHSCLGLIYSSVIPQKRPSAQLQRSSIFHQLHSIVFGMP